MSDIPKARKIIEELLATSGLKRIVYDQLNVAYKLLSREPPKFRADPEYKPPTKAQAVEIKKLRARGWSVNKIADYTGTTIGRVSEIINDLKEGV